MLNSTSPRLRKINIPQERSNGKRKGYMGDKDLETLWTVCSNLETLLLSDAPERFPASFATNLKDAFGILRREYANCANHLMGEDVTK